MSERVVVQAPELTRLHTLLDEAGDLLGLPSSLLTLEGRECVSVGEARVCSEFHRKHTASGRECRKCMAKVGTYASSRSFFVYLCPYHLWRIAVPVTIGERHVATLLGPPFFRSENEPKSGYFLSLAQRYGYPVRDYEDALAEVSVLSEKEVEEARKKYIVLGHFLSHNLTHLHRSMTEAARRKNVEERLNRLENNLRAIFEHAGTAMAMVREDGALIHVNTRCGELLGEDRTHLIGRRWTSIFLPDQQHVLDEFNRCRKGGAASPSEGCEAVIRRADGEEIDVLLTVGKISERPLYLISLVDRRRR
ncbi:PAS domain S-box-containing protein [Methanofollis sp. W23]|uniref:PocR ligand-binding domain-containing protein n=1 Tax=Methanofollis sp. W23 TaxID=2817849 RepID=UPI001AE4FC4E|nr:PocR ligand-binding domain-containing protein [Methanofollis sp. W23]MBP2145730.1 PAS domain S-box-containing protein [Methanofollis sp. W23]